jgi:ATP-dependent Clp protease ATP-binding subunit ClpA
MEIKEFQKQLKKKGVNLKMPAQVRVDICKRAAKENMGARPLQRIFRNEIQTICARKILEDQELKEISFCFKDKLISIS